MRKSKYELKLLLKGKKELLELKLEAQQLKQELEAYKRLERKR